jgi:hypothetical protein
MHMPDQSTQLGGSTIPFESYPKPIDVLLVEDNPGDVRAEGEVDRSGTPYFSLSDGAQ